MYRRRYQVDRLGLSIILVCVCRKQRFFAGFGRLNLNISECFCLRGCRDVVYE